MMTPNDALLLVYTFAAIMVAVGGALAMWDGE